MLLYFDRNGALKESLEYGSPARAGTTAFKVIAIFSDLANLDGISAVLKLYKPDLMNTAYPLLGMTPNTNFVFDSSYGESAYLRNGNTYAAFEFDFGDFNGGQEEIVLLDTPGLWRAVVSLIGTDYNVQGVANINVQYGISDENETIISWGTIISIIEAQLATKLDLNSGFYVRVVSGISEGILSDIVENPTHYAPNAILYAKDTHKFYQIENMSTGEVSEIVLNLSTAIFGHIYKESISEDNEYITKGEGDSLYINNIEGVVVLNDTLQDIDDYEEGQLFFVKDKATMGFYTKNAMGSLSRTYQFIGLIYRNGVISTNTTLSDAEMKEVEKQFCVMWYNPENSLYIKTSTDSGYATFTKQIGVSNYSDYVRITIKSIVVNCNSGADYGKASLYGQNSDVPTKAYTDTTFAKLGGDNTFTGLNTFENYLPQSELEPSNQYDLPNKGYVDTEVGNVNTALTNHKNDTSNPHQVNKGQVGLGNVDNVKQVPNSEKGVANGVATLDSNAKIPLSQLPDSVLGQVEYCGTWNANLSTDQTIRTPRKGDYYICATSGGDYNPDGTNTGLDYELGDWAIYDGSAWEKIDNTDAVQSVNGYTGAVVLTKGDLGLGNVDNTSDLDKPVSTATQTALNTKLGKDEASSLYQTKIIAYPLLNISTASWTQDSETGKWYYETTVSSDDLSVGANDKYLLGGNDKNTTDELANCNINIDDIVTNDNLTTITLVGNFQPSIALNVSIVIAKVTPSTYSGLTFLTTDDIDDDTLKILNSKLQVNKDKFVNIAIIPENTTLANLITNYGNNFSLYFKTSASGSTILTIGVQATHDGYCEAEIERKSTHARWASLDIATSTTIGSLMTNTYSKPYLTEVKTSNVDSESATNGQVLTANGSGGASWQTPSVGTKLYKHQVRGLLSTNQFAPAVEIISTSSTPISNDSALNIIIGNAIKLSWGSPALNQYINFGLNTIAGDGYKLTEGKVFTAVTLSTSGTIVTDTNTIGTITDTVTEL